MARAAGEIILADHHNFGENGVGAVAVTAGTDTTTSTTYVNLAGTGSQASFSFTKYATATRVHLDLTASYFTTASTSGAMFGLRINGVDYDVALLRAVLPAANAHLQAAGFTYVAASVIPAGTYTVEGRWKRMEGAGTLTRDTGDWLAISARELI